MVLLQGRLKLRLSVDLIEKRHVQHSLLALLFVGGVQIPLIIPILHVFIKCLHGHKRRVEFEFDQ